MMAKPVKTPELHYPMIHFLIIVSSRFSLIGTLYINTEADYYYELSNRPILIYYNSA